jgi:hypothetical protein
LKRRTLLGAAAAAAAAPIAAWPQADLTPGEQRLKAMQQARTGAPRAPVSAERLQQRADLLAQGEAALARQSTQEAVALFDSAALILHAADTELGLVRGYMQAGEYRRALAFGAHTAGAHLDVVGGAALYAWLLHAGGQGVVARRLLAEAHARAPDQPLLREVTRQLARPWPLASGALLEPPARLAPYAVIAPSGASVVATGTLVRAGQAVLVPAAALRGGPRLWVRNGLGQTVAARPARGAAVHGLVELVLTTPLPSAGSGAATREPFPGSVAVAVGYAPGADAQPAWPLLHAGFLGAALPAPGVRALGVQLPPASARGEPVFDQRGALIGIAVRQDNADRLVTMERLQQQMRPELIAQADPSAAVLGLDAIYEAGLQRAVQVLARRA